MNSFIAQAPNNDAQLLALVIGLVVVAVLLTGLTIWYWRYTSPKRRIKTRPVSQVPARNPRATRIDEQVPSVTEEPRSQINLAEDTPLGGGLQRPADIESGG